MAGGNSHQRAIQRTRLAREEALAVKFVAVMDEQRAKAQEHDKASSIIPEIPKIKLPHHEKVRRFFAMEILSISVLSTFGMGFIDVHRFYAAHVCFSLACAAGGVQLLLRAFAYKGKHQFLKWVIIATVSSAAILSDNYLSDVVNESQTEFYSSKISAFVKGTNAPKSVKWVATLSAPTVFNRPTFWVRMKDQLCWGDISLFVSITNLQSIQGSIVDIKYQAKDFAGDWRDLSYLNMMGDLYFGADVKQLMRWQYMSGWGFLEARIPGQSLQPGETVSGAVLLRFPNGTARYNFPEILTFRAKITDSTGETSLVELATAAAGDVAIKPLPPAQDLSAMPLGSSCIHW